MSILTDELRTALEDIAYPVQGKGVEPITVSTNEGDVTVTRVHDLVQIEMLPKAEKPLADELGITDAAWSAFKLVHETSECVTVTIKRPDIIALLV